MKFIWSLALVALLACGKQDSNLQPPVKELRAPVTMVRVQTQDGLFTYTLDFGTWTYLDIETGSLLLMEREMIPPNIVAAVDSILSKGNPQVNVGGGGPKQEKMR